MNEEALAADRAPGDPVSDDAPDGQQIWKQVRGYLIGLMLATGLSVLSFAMVGTTLVWAPSIPIAISVLAIAKMGVHLVFFLHTTSGPDNVNNLMALAFGLLIVMLLVFGSLWIMSHLNHNMMPMPQIMGRQR